MSKGFHLTASLAEQDRTGVPDHAGSAASDLQGMVLPRILHDEELSSPGKLHRCGDLQSPRTRALLALKRRRDSRFAAVPFPGSCGTLMDSHHEVRHPGHPSLNLQLTGTGMSPAHPR
jgi:hypothetical protein